eukprot:11763203-Prorocentrum_lima.AAC.1
MAVEDLLKQLLKSTNGLGHLPSHVGELLEPSEQEEGLGGTVVGDKERTGDCGEQQDEEDNWD